MILPDTDPLAQFVALGYELIPLHPWDTWIDGRERGKSPRDGEWQRVVYTYEDVLAWRAAGGNVGVRLREQDLVIDWDPRNAVPADGDVLARFQADTGIDFRDYPCVVTGSGGFHFYTLRDGDWFPTRADLKATYGKGLEFKAAPGRQVVAPGSRHPSGTHYGWADWSTPLALAPTLPPTIADLIRKPVREKRTGEAARLPKQQVLMILDQLSPLDYQDQGDWFELMQAIHYASGGDDEVKDDWVKWSTSDPNYAGDAEVISQRWDSLDENVEGGIGVGTLFKHVGDAGGTPYLPASMVFKPIGPPVVVTETGEERPIYEPLFSRDNQDLPKACYNNALEGLHGLGLDIARDTFTQQDYLRNAAPVGLPDGSTVTDEIVGDIKYFLCKRYGLQAKTSELNEAVTALARLNSYDSLTDHLDNLVWDGTPRVADWIGRYCEVEESLYVRSVGRIFLMGLVARAYAPGVMFQSLVIFEGKQGIGKSTMLKILAGGRSRMKEGIRDIGGKDSMVELLGKWIVEIADLAGFRKTEAEVLKDFISRDVDSVRPPYGRRSIDLPRRCVLAGNTNEGEYLTDTTGNRRYLPVQLRSVNLATLARDRDQLLAEAVQMWKQDPDPKNLQIAESLWTVAAVEQEGRRIEDPWEDLVRTWLNKTNESCVTTTMILRDGLQRVDGARSASVLETKRISRIMNLLGWQKCKVTDGEGNRVNGYRLKD